MLILTSLEYGFTNEDDIMSQIDWLPDHEQRMDVISQNGNDGNHYEERCSGCMTVCDKCKKPEYKDTQFGITAGGTIVHDDVTNPSHYNLIPEKNVQVIDVIRAALTEEEFRGYCKGNRIKYSLRGGKKDGESEEKDAGKARQYIDFQLEK